MVVVFNEKHEHFNQVLQLGFPFSSRQALSGLLRTEHDYIPETTHAHTSLSSGFTFCAVLKDCVQRVFCMRLRKDLVLIFRGFLTAGP